MFETLAEKLELTFKRLRGQGKITEKNIHDALREVRIALLEADVHLQVVKGFLESVRDKALGQEVFHSLTPEQHFVKIVKEELIQLLGGERRELDLRGAPPLIVVLVGLQGSGKTTTLAKLALHLKKEKQRRPYLVSADIYRPAATEQLRILGQGLEMPVHDSRPGALPVVICQEALEEAKRQICDLLLIDTAGRMHIDEELMEELKAIQEAMHSHHILLVADAMTGQDAVNQARGFNARLDLSGIILTKMDGDARGGAALSMVQVVGKPILFAGVGEKPDALEPFYPDRLASRILGMGDLLSLVEKAERGYQERERHRAEELDRGKQFSLEDFQVHLHTLKKMGSITELLDLIPGGKKLAQKVDLNHAEGELKRFDTIIHSMTIAERRNPALLNGSRRLRIARGSGTTVAEVNRLVKRFLEMKKMMQRLHKMGGRGLLNRMTSL